jgi:hypothetical protein
LSLNATPGSYTLTVSASGADGTTVKRSTVTVTSPAAVAGTASVGTAPTLSMPASFTVAATSGQITLPAGALGSDSVSRTLVLSVSGGTLTASGLSGSGITASGASSGVSTLTLTGSASSLSAYLAAAGNVLFSGTAGQSYTLTATAQVISGGLVQSATSRQATVSAVAPVALGSSGAATAPAIVQLPQALPIVLNTASDLVFTGIDLDDGNAGEPLVLTLGVASGVLSAVTGGPVNVGGDGTALTLSGTAAQLESYLQAQSVSYSGPAGTLGLTLARAAAPNGASSSASLNLQSAGTQTQGGSALASLVLPATVNTTPGVSAALPFGSTPLVATGLVTVALTASSNVTLTWSAESHLRVSDAVGAAPIGNGSGAAATLSLARPSRSTPIWRPARSRRAATAR